MTTLSPEPATELASSATARAAADSAVRQESVARIRVESRSGWRAIDFAELWRYRELTAFLALRDIKVRYKQTILGAAWAIIQPVMNTVVFTLFFNKLAGVGGNDPLYFVKTFCAILPWQLFENSLTSSSNSLVTSQNLITKVYFPRLAIPISSVLAGVLDFAIGFAILVIVLGGYFLWGDHSISFGWNILACPLFVVMALLLSLGAGLWLSAMNVLYRDIRYAVPFLLRLWFFATPVAYPLETVTHKLSPALQFIYGLNPMVGVIQGFRWSILGSVGGGDAPGMAFAASSTATLVLLFGGALYFRRTEKTFADFV